MLKIAMAQMDPEVGAFEANVKKILDAYERACSQQARLLLTPELALCGYPPFDLLDRAEMLERNERALTELQKATLGKSCALAVGHVGKNPASLGRALRNQVTVLERGQRVFEQAKSLLPTYDVFDEARYFEPASEIHLWDCDGYSLAFAICEDLWGESLVLGRRVYPRLPVDTYRDLGAQAILTLASSPFERGKSQLREGLHARVAQQLGVPVVYLNQVGATDEILFDGGSFLVNPEGQIQGRLPFFKNALGICRLFEKGAPVFESPGEEDREDQIPPNLELLSRALVTGIRNYFSRTGFEKALIGLSGGIDSAVVAALAVRALGARNVMGVAMPSQYSSSHSIEDAEKLAQNLGIVCEVRPIKFFFSTLVRELAERRGQLAPLAVENLQARLRGTILMTLSNHFGSLVLTTGNKSELSMGYCTQYGDMVGALAPLGDVWKTDVYALARYLNQTWGKGIPDRTLTKAPSAELRPHQTDQDTLPPYDLLDEFLSDYLEKGLSASELEMKFEQSGRVSAGWVKPLLKTFEKNEFKRRQGAPILKVSSKAFGVGRRIPLAKRWEL